MKPKRIVVVGSRSFPITPEVGAEIVDVLRSYPADTVFLTRGSAGFDTFLMAVGDILDLAVQACPAKGGSTNFDRDVAMVRESDEVLVFIDPDSLHNQNTGTAHIAEKALDQKKPTKAWTVAANHLVYAGSSD
jgi:hypothetical protein